MNNEETIIDPLYTTESKQTETTSAEQPNVETKEQKKGMGWGEKAAYAAGGAVIGAGMTAAGQAMATPTAEEPEEKDDDNEELVATAEQTDEGVKPEDAPNENAEGVTIETGGTTIHVTGDAKVDIENGTVHVSSAQTAEQPAVSNVNVENQPAPDPEDAIVATATGIRVAQVDDNASFSQAFADARAQVGPGGVFEWHGRAYGTYYKDEWDNMTAEQKHEYQASIDYKDVLSDESMAQHHNEMAQHNVSHSNAHHTSHNETVQTPEPVDQDIDVQVLEIGQTDLNNDGVPENGAVLEIDGREVLIVDVDWDGKADVAVCDIDGDGQYEYRDLSDADIAMPSQSDGDAYMAQASAEPDYMNDANVDIYEA